MATAAFCAIASPAQGQEPGGAPVLPDSLERIGPTAGGGTGPDGGRTESTESSLPVASDAEPFEEGGVWLGLRGRPEPDRIYPGMWALHLKRVDDGLSPHHLIGASWRGFYGGTFVNTHAGRGWSAGIGRSVIAADWQDVGFTMGYRIGAVTGYDGRLMDLADRWPVLPLAQFTADARYGRVGVQATWAWIVLTFGGFISVGR